MSRDTVAPVAPRVSVVMAAYNYDRYIADAIRSVLRQTIADWELIIVDDGSTDGTPQAVEPFLGDCRVRYIRQPNRGQPAALNEALKHARGEWTAFLDADDSWLEDKLPRQLARARENDAADVIYSDRVFVNPYGDRIHTPHQAHYRGGILRQLFRDNVVPFSSAMVRSSSIRQIGCFNGDYRHANDYDLWLRLAADGCSFDFVDEPLLLYRTGHVNLTSRVDVQLKTALRVMDDFIDRHPKTLPRGWVNRCYSETYTHLGMYLHRNGKLGAARIWYLRGIARCPANRESWAMLLRTIAPSGVVEFLRRTFVVSNGSL